MYFTGLEKSTEYNIRLTALNVNGSGPATAWLTAETYAHDLDGWFFFVMYK